MPFKPFNSDKFQPNQNASYGSFGGDSNAAQTFTPFPEGKQGLLKRAAKNVSSNFGGLVKPALDVASGVGKSFARTGATVLSPVTKLLGKVGIQAGQGITEEELKPKGFYQGVGNIVGSGLQYIGGGRGVAQAATSITKSVAQTALPKVAKELIDIAGRSVLEASAGFGLTRLQGGSNKDAKTAGIISGAIPWAGAAFQALKPVKLGEKIQTVVIKPTATDLKNGFKIENLNKYNLGGNLEQSAAKTQAAIEQRASQLRQILAPGSAKVNLNETYQAVAKAVEATKFKNAGSNLAVKRELDNFLQEIQQLSPSGTVDIANAQLAKRAFGANGAWEYNVPRADANAIETIYTSAYNVLKKQIEVAAGQSGSKVAALNKELSEIIPIEHALIRRLPVSARNAPLSLTDLVSIIGGNKLGLPLFVLNRALKSGKVGAALAGTPATRGTVGTLISGPGKEQLKQAGTLKDVVKKIPQVNVGLGIEDVGANRLKAEELGRKINELNARWVKQPTPANKKALESAKELYKQLLPKRF